MAPSSPGSRPRPPGGLRPALTPTPGDAHRQRRGAGSNKPRSPRFQGIAKGRPAITSVRGSPDGTRTRGRRRNLGAVTGLSRFLLVLWASKKPRHCAQKDAPCDRPIPAYGQSFVGVASSAALREARKLELFPSRAKVSGHRHLWALERGNHLASLLRVGRGWCGPHWLQRWRLPPRNAKQSVAPTWRTGLSETAPLRE